MSVVSHIVLLAITSFKIQKVAVETVTLCYLLGDVHSASSSSHADSSSVAVHVRCEACCSHAGQQLQCALPPCLRLACLQQCAVGVVVRHYACCLHQLQLLHSTRLRSVTVLAVTVSQRSVLTVSIWHQ